jgi:rubrerythrin
MNNAAFKFDWDAYMRDRGTPWEQDEACYNYTQWYCEDCGEPVDQGQFLCPTCIIINEEFSRMDGEECQM